MSLLTNQTLQQVSHQFKKRKKNVDTFTNLFVYVVCVGYSHSCPAVFWVAKTCRGQKEADKIREYPGLSPVSLLYEPKRWISILGLTDNLCLSASKQKNSRRHNENDSLEISTL